MFSACWIAGILTTSTFVIGDGVVLRGSKDVSSERLALIEINTPVKLLERGEPWSRIEAKNAYQEVTKGYVQSIYLAKAPLKASEALERSREASKIKEAIRWAERAAAIRAAPATLETLAGHYHHAGRKKLAKRVLRYTKEPGELFAYCTQGQYLLIAEQFKDGKIRMLKNAGDLPGWHKSLIRMRVGQQRWYHRKSDIGDETVKGARFVSEHQEHSEESTAWLVTKQGCRPSDPLLISTSHWRRPKVEALGFKASLGVAKRLTVEAPDTKGKRLHGISGFKLSETGHASILFEHAGPFYAQDATPIPFSVQWAVVDRRGRIVYQATLGPQRRRVDAVALPGRAMLLVTEGADCGMWCAGGPEVVILEEDKVQADRLRLGTGGC